MTRGRPPARALDKAKKIAVKRGFVHFYERGQDLLADFSITGPELLAEVRIKRMRCIRLPVEGLEREAAAEIAGLKMFPSSREISRELWISSPDYFWRHFRVCDNGLAELGRDGIPLLLKSPVFRPEAANPVTRPATRSPVLVTDIPAPSPPPAPVSAGTISLSDEGPPRTGGESPGIDPLN